MPNLLQAINMGDCDYGTTDWVELLDTSRQRRTASGVSLSKPRTFSRATDKKMRKCFKPLQMEIGGGYAVLESSISSIFWLLPFNQGWLKILLKSLRRIPRGLARSEKIRWAEVSHADSYRQGA